MKIMVAADIHGSAYYCEKLLKKYKEEACDKLLLLGDILYHGPRNDLPEEYNPKKVLAMLNEMKNEILCVRGNCDTEVDQMVLEFPVLAEYCLLYLDHITIFATHVINLIKILCLILQKMRYYYMVIHMCRHVRKSEIICI